MKNRLDKLQAILDNADLEYDAIELADALWLSQYIDSSDKVATQDSAIKKREREIPPLKPSKPTPKEEKITKPTGKKITIKIEGEVEVSAHVSTKSTKNRGLPIGIKQEPYRFNQSALYNALRYFRQKRVSTSHFRLDIDKTVDIKADTGLFVPQYKPKYENRFNLLIVIDNSDIMELWREEIKKLTDGIKSFNLFMGIQEIYMDSSKEEPKFFRTKNRSGIGFSNVSQYFINETLVMMVSDMSSSAWRSGKISEKLNSWQNKARLFAMQTFPSHLWDRTVLKDTEIVRFFGNRNRKFNGTLKSDADDMLDFLYDDFKNKNRLKLPIATMELSSLEALSKVIVGKDGSSVGGAIFYESKEEIEEKSDRSDMERVSIFTENSSKLAQELAYYLSVVPLDMNVMKMVQRLMIKEPTKVHLAEILTSGLLEKDDDLYRFYHADKNRDGIREILQNQLGTIKYIQTLQKLSEYVGENLGFSSYFKAILQNSQTDKNGKLNKHDTEFARINIKRLQRLGGEWKKIAQRLTVEIEAIIPTSKRFQMGSKDGRDNEKPVHEVIINYDFEISPYPVTFEEYDLFCEDKKREKSDDQGWGRGKRPVINVSWNDAKAYCDWISEKTKETYRLPTEAEWEYACRVGTTTKWSFGDDKKVLKKYARYSKNSDNKTQLVGEKLPNPWGLYDMHGNVWEWCEDDYVETYEKTPRDGKAHVDKKVDRKVLRGGSWNYNAGLTHSSVRGRDYPSYRDIDVGFRLLRTLNEKDKIGQVISKKENMIFNKLPKQLTSFLVSDMSKFYGRDDKLKELDSLLETNDLLSIVGVDGIGKTTLVSKYLNDKKEIYDYYAFVLIHNNFKQSIVDGFSESLNIVEDDIDIAYNEIINKLNRLQGNKILVLDDIDNVQEYKINIMNELQEWRIIFVSRGDIFDFQKLVLDKIPLKSGFVSYNCSKCDSAYVLNCDDLDWGAGESHERGMEAETRHSAEYYVNCDNCNNEISLTFNCWEYPVGTEGHKDVESRGIENLKGDCCLDLMKNENEYNESNYEEISTSDIKEWFFENYDDPANLLPYETKEGGYQYIWGGPYELREALNEEYENLVSHEVIEEVAKEIERKYGDILWSPQPKEEDIHIPEEKLTKKNI